MECNNYGIYVSNGCSKEAIKLFEKMEYVGIDLNNVTFITALSYKRINIRNNKR